MPKIVIRS